MICLKWFSSYGANHKFSTWGHRSMVQGKGRGETYVKKEHPGEVNAAKDIWSCLHVQAVGGGGSSGHRLYTDLCSNHFAASILSV